MKKTFGDRIGTSISKCGICCEKSLLCDKCVEATLRSNGLPLVYKNRIKDLSDIDTAHAWAEYSPFKVELYKIIEEERIVYNSKIK